MRDFSALQYMAPSVAVAINGTIVTPCHPFNGLYRLNVYNPSPALAHELQVQKHARIVAMYQQVDDQLRALEAVSDYGRSHEALAAQAMQLPRIIDSTRPPPAAHARALPPLELYCGINIGARSRQGLLLYRGGRLVHMYTPVGLQKTGAPWDDYGCGGVVCVINLPARDLDASPGHDSLLSKAVRKR